MSRRNRTSPQPHHACTIRALRELGYRWVRVPDRYRRDQWVLSSPHERWYGAPFAVYWNGDGHDVRLRTPVRWVDKSVDLFAGPTPQAVTKRANAIIAEFRRRAELDMVENRAWGVTMGPGGSSRDRRRARRAIARVMEAARKEVYKEVPF